MELWTICAAIFITSLISGILGMAGGMILMGVLAHFLDPGTAFVLHGGAQAASNGSRCLLSRDHVRWNVLLGLTIGSLLTALILSWIRVFPSRSVIFILLGVLPGLSLLFSRLTPPSIESPWGSLVAGLVTTFAQLTAGASGPLLDVFFVRGNFSKLSAVATKAAGQTLGHGLKLAYFTQVSVGASTILWNHWLLFGGLAVLGSYVGKHVLNYLSDRHFKKLNQWAIAGLSIAYLIKGLLQSG